MLYSKIYILWACIGYGFISAASESGAADAVLRKKIYSTSVATCITASPAVFARKLYYLSSTGIASIRLPRDQSAKSQPQEIIALELPEQTISALAVDAKKQKFFMSCGSRLGEIDLGSDSHVLESSNEPEPEWHRPADSIDFYKPELGDNLSPAISMLYLAPDKELLFSAAADRICRWSTSRRTLDAIQQQTSATLAMAVVDDALFTVHANGDVQSKALERGVVEHHATFNGKAMRIATFDEAEKVLYAVSQDGNLYAVDAQALKVTHAADNKKAGVPTALAIKNHGLFIGYENGTIKFYDIRKPNVRVGRVATGGAMPRQLWYDRAKHNLVSLSADNIVQRYWIE
jgi:hypothetical protein